MLIGFIIKKTGIYIVKKTCENIVKDKSFLEPLKRYRAGNISWYNVAKFTTDAILVCV